MKSMMIVWTPTCKRNALESTTFLGRRNSCHLNEIKNITGVLTAIIITTATPLSCSGGPGGRGDTVLIPSPCKYFDVSICCFFLFWLSKKCKRDYNLQKIFLLWNAVSKENIWKIKQIPLEVRFQGPGQFSPHPLPFYPRKTPFFFYL